MRELFSRGEVSAWRSDGFIETERCIRDKYPKEVIDRALDLLGAPASKRPVFNDQVLNSLSNLAVWTHLELKPGGQHVTDLLVAIQDAANTIATLHSSLHDTARAALDQAATNGACSIDWFSYAHPIREGRLPAAMSVVSQLASWAEQAVSELPKQGRGAPRKDALLDWAVTASNIYCEVTGRRATRRVEVVPLTDWGDEILKETGKFRKFANIILDPLGLSLSDSLAKRALQQDSQRME
ncbi:hypothetical protein [Sphingomonas sp.]|uniref:hypothetical protein n=1 Tax=Sphingomonas sp. TaxID=28214 RepID=UPI0025D9C5F3|nr:hypothetical protein [Sphingomonas sp.]